MAAASGLRIGDADREAAAAALREHFAHGRLTLEEFQHRLSAVFAAKTDRDLAIIAADLPHVTAPPTERPAVEAAGRREGSYRRPSLAVMAGFIMIILALVLVAFVLPVALVATAISRSLLFLLAILLFGRRGMLRRLRRWLPQRRRRRPF